MRKNKMLLGKLWFNSPILIWLLSICINITPQLSAQTGDEQEGEGDVFELDPFVVEDTYLAGYVSNSAKSGFKTRQRLIDIPQAIQVVPRDIIEDLAQFNGTADTLQYAVSGVVPFVRGEIQIQRGTRAIFQPLFDGLPELAQRIDSASIDSIEVIKGPASVLYGNLGSFNGIIIKNSKQPLSTPFGRVKVLGDTEGTLRFEADFTGPIGQLTENSSASYRLVAAGGELGSFIDAGPQESNLFAPSIRFDIGNNTNITLQADILRYKDDAVSTWNFYDGSGSDKVYTVAGSDHGYIPDWEDFSNDRDMFKLNVKHAFTRHLHMDANIYYTKRELRHREMRPTGPPNLETFEMGTYYLSIDSENKGSGIFIDFVSDYRIAGVKNQSNFGGRATRGHSAGTTSLTYADTFEDDDDAVLFPVTDIRTNERLYMPFPAETFDRARRTTPIRGNFTDVYQLYYLHTIEPIEDKLILVGGIGYEGVRRGNETRSPWGTAPVDVEITDVAYSKITAHPHRLGVVYKVTDEIAVFANNSTRYEPQSGFDIDDKPYPDIEGEVKEIGLKTSLLNGRISSTITYFDMDIQNQRIVATKELPNGAVRTGFRAVGVTTNKGLEVDIALRPIDNWQIILAGYFGENLDNNGVQLGNSIKEHMAITTKYDFGDGPLEGLSLGLSAVKVGPRKGSILNSVERLNLFFGYRLNDHLNFRLNIDNVTDELTPINGWASWILRIGEPRTYKFSAAYTF